MTEAQMRAMNILPWEEIAERFGGSDLLLGNGFSINMCSSLNYISLFDEFLADCSEAEKQTYRAFNTSNFEFIMDDLLGASKVNSIFGLETTRIEAAIERLRDGLIKAIEKNHPRCQDVDWARIRTISESLDYFNDVFTLNYDVLIYHIIMDCLDRHKTNPEIRPYNDYYWSRYDSKHLEFMDFQNIAKYKHIYYLHGALFLFKKQHLNLKICRGSGTELIEQIASEIRSGNLPLFVSEGNAQEKELTISNSAYLQFASKKLTETGRPIVIYGTSLSDPDKHIRKAVRNRSNVAYSIYVGSRTEKQVNQEILDIMARLSRKDIHIFDSSTLFQ